MLLSVGVMPADVLGALEGVGRDVAIREVNHRIAAGVEVQKDISASAEPHVPRQRASLQC